MKAILLRPMSNSRPIRGDVRQFSVSGKRMVCPRVWQCLSPLVYGILPREKARVWRCLSALVYGILPREKDTHREDDARLLPVDY